MTRKKSPEELYRGLPRVQLTKELEQKARQLAEDAAEELAGELLQAGKKQIKKTLSGLLRLGDKKFGG